MLPQQFAQMVPHYELDPNGEVPGKLRPPIPDQTLNVMLSQSGFLNRLLETSISRNTLWKLSSFLQNMVITVL